MARAIEAGKRSAIERKAEMESLFSHAGFPPAWSVDVLMSDQDALEMARRLAATWEMWQ